MFRSLRLRFHLFLSQVVPTQSSGISEQGLACAGSGYEQDVFPTWKLITKVTMTAMTAFSESGMSASELPGVPRDGAWNRPPRSSQHTPKQERGENRVREGGSTPSVFDSQKACNQKTPCRLDGYLGFGPCSVSHQTMGLKARLPPPEGSHCSDS